MITPMVFSAARSVSKLPGLMCSGFRSSVKRQSLNTSTSPGVAAAAQLVTTGRRRILRLAQHGPWTGKITAALERLALRPNPG